MTKTDPWYAYRQKRMGRLAPPATIYLAGPMRGYPEYNFPYFDAAAADLRSKGFTVWSPAEYDRQHGFDPAAPDAEKKLLRLRDYMKVDLPQVLHSDAVVLLQEWRLSEGAKLEEHVARVCGVPRFSYPDLSPIPKSDPWGRDTWAEGFKDYLHKPSQGLLWEFATKSPNAQTKLFDVDDRYFKINLEKPVNKDPYRNLRVFRTGSEKQEAKSPKPQGIDKLSELQAQFNKAVGEMMEKYTQLKPYDWQLSFFEGDAKPEPDHLMDAMGYKDDYWPPATEHQVISDEPNMKDVWMGDDGKRIVTDAVTGGQKETRAARMDLLPWDQLWKVAELYAYGATKYEDRNWERGYKFSLSIAAMQRHAAKYIQGEDIDEENGCHHLTAVVFHALALMRFGDMVASGKLDHSMDDRGKL